MIWLAAIGGAGPISSTGSAVATVTIDSVSFKLYSGYNGSTRVFSFVASSEATSFSGDILTFLKYLETNQGFPSSQYLTSIGAGTEPFTGMCTLSNARMGHGLTYLKARTLCSQLLLTRLWSTKLDIRF
jgi:xyloglucan-specific endo-beta-1,4-glucanase